jgi:transposase
MQDRELYEKLLGLKAPWIVTDVNLQVAESKVTVAVGHAPMTEFACPECGVLCKVHDHRRRQWRHLDSCSFVTMIDADVPRVKCPTHGCETSDGTVGRAG